jgi:hypothetical protein
VFELMPNQEAEEDQQSGMLSGSGKIMAAAGTLPQETWVEPPQEKHAPMSTAAIIGWLALLAGISVLSCIGGTLALYVIEGGLEGTRWLVPVMLLCGIVPPLVQVGVNNSSVYLLPADP